MRHKDKFSAKHCVVDSQCSAQILSDLFLKSCWAPLSQVSHNFTSTSSHLILSVGGLLPSKGLCPIQQPHLASFFFPFLQPLPVSPGRTSLINYLLRVCFWGSQTKSPCKNNYTLKSLFSRDEYYFTPVPHCRSVLLPATAATKNNNNFLKSKKLNTFEI